VVLDGWGKGKNDQHNAIFMSKTPFVDSLYSQWSNAELRTDGENVGLPNRQMGNSEVGHVNIGAGRIVYQDLVRIDKEIQSRNFFNNQILVEAFDKAEKNNVSIHFMGLVSNGGVHSHIDHLKALCTAVSARPLNNVFIHAFTDGRDTDPHSGNYFIEELEKHIENTSVRIATVTGRYYAMDRDRRWERVKVAYDALVKGEGKRFLSAGDVLKDSYAKGVTDEFILPGIIVGNDNVPVGVIKEGDVVICFNYRTDRCREITQVLTQTDFDEFQMHPLRLHYVTMTNYDDTYRNVHVMYEKDHLKSTLGEVVSRHGLTQLRIAETEKYPHVTFFFSGGREKPFEGENRIMVHSPKVATYDLQPEMSALEVTDRICKEMQSSAPDFICLNFANPDMVGHTGVFSAIVKAVETIDHCLKQVVNAGLEKGYSFVIIADHGNADYAVNEDGSPNTAHTTNPVPIFIIDKDITEVRNGILADVAPTILDLMHLEPPVQMTGKSLVKR